MRALAGIFAGLLLTLLAPASTARAYDITNRFSISGIAAGVYQYQFANGEASAEDAGRGAVCFQPEFSFRPTLRDELFARIGLAAGNGLNRVTPFNLLPWAAYLQDDVKDINGRNRDYLLTAWYKHTFQFSENHTLALTGGLIDSTEYLDENAFANDEFTQFMNQALVNGPNSNAPSYDFGGAVQWAMNGFAISGAYMNVGENDAGNNFNFFGVQIKYTVNSALGEGNYRLILEGTDDAFLNPANTGTESREAVFLSFDQMIGEILGGWIRFGWQSEDAAVDYRSLYSGGIHISGELWGRQQDNIGIGYCYLIGGNTGFEHTQVAEGYVRFDLTGGLAATLDVQYMNDTYAPGAGTDVCGWIAGVRMTFEF